MDSIKGDWSEIKDKFKNAFNDAGSDLNSTDGKKDLSRGTQTKTGKNRKGIEQDMKGI